LETSAQIFARNVASVDAEIQSRNWKFVEESILHRLWVDPATGESAFVDYVFPTVEYFYFVMLSYRQCSQEHCHCSQYKENIWFTK
jgi:hypothetical protein